MSLELTPEKTPLPAETPLERWRSTGTTRQEFGIKVVFLQPLEVESVLAGFSLDQPVLAEWKSMGDKEFTGCKLMGEDLRPQEGIAFVLSRLECSFEE